MSELEIGQPVIMQAADGNQTTGHITAINRDRGIALVFSEQEGHVRRGLGPIGDLVGLSDLRPAPEVRS